MSPILPLVARSWPRDVSVWPLLLLLSFVTTCINDINWPLRLLASQYLSELSAEVITNCCKCNLSLRMYEEWGMSSMRIRTHSSALDCLILCLLWLLILDIVICRVVESRKIKEETLFYPIEAQWNIRTYNFHSFSSFSSPSLLPFKLVNMR